MHYLIERKKPDQPDAEFKRIGNGVIEAKTMRDAMIKCRGFCEQDDVIRVYALTFVHTFPISEVRW